MMSFSITFTPQVFIEPLSQMLKKKEIEFTPEQIKEYKSIFDKLFNSI